MNSVLDALLETLRGPRVSFDETPSSFRGDRAQTGDAREYSVSELLLAYFPTTWTVKKGPIYDVNGERSQSIDSVLCVPDHPPMRTPQRDVILAEGVHSATEVKPDLSTHSDKSEFHRGLLQIASVKRLYRQIEGVFPGRLTEDYPIPCALFTAIIRDIESAISYMDDFKQAEKVRPSELPDLIVALDKGVVYHTHDGATSLVRDVMPKLGADPSGEISLILPARDHHVLAWYLYLLYNFAGPRPYIGSPVLLRYLKDLQFPEGFKFLRHN